MDDETLTLDPGLDYGSVEGLSLEVRERLQLIRPTNFVSAIPTLTRNVRSVLNGPSHDSGSGEAHGRNDTGITGRAPEVCQTDARASCGFCVGRVDLLVYADDARIPFVQPRSTCQLLEPELTLTERHRERPVVHVNSRGLPESS